MKFAKLLSFMAALALGRSAYAETGENPDVGLAFLRYPGGEWNPRPHGLPRLAWEIKKRTSIAISLEVAAVEPTSEGLSVYPFVAWLGDRNFPALSEGAIAALRQHLMRGGTLLIDLSDATPGGGFDRAVRRELGRIFPDQPPTRIPNDHVVNKSFFLLDRTGGRVLARPYFEGLYVGQRLAVVISSNDLMGAISRDEFGQWDYDVGQAGEATREASFRAGMNVIMYALCLDYKEDQVHIPFILQRRR